MTGPAPPTRVATRAVSEALARQSYGTGKVRLASRDLTGCDHLASTRRGLFAVGRDGCRLIAHGQFFGLTVDRDAVLAFEACDALRAPTAMGRIVRLRIHGGRITAAEVVAQGLNNGCHQIDVIDDRILVVDTYRQRVVTVEPTGCRDERSPLPDGQDGDWSAGYVHMNAVIDDGRQRLLLLHNGADHTGRASELAVLDPDGTLRERRPLPGFGCHDLAILEDGSVLSCGSYAGELIGSDGRRVKVTGLMTRGLSVGDEVIAVGGSQFADRARRDGQAGEVWFLDRRFRPTGMTPTPAAPTAICRIDGHDLTLSNHVRRRGLTVRWPA